MGDKKPRTPREIRLYFEASLASLAKLSAEPHRQFRETFKWFMARHNIIRRSTSELSCGQLEAFAEVMSKFANKMNGLPPSERSNIDFGIIFNDFI